MSEKAGAHILLTGRVQMVGFRWFVRRWAEDLDLAGWVKNNPAGSVETRVEGKRDEIDLLLKELKVGPRGATVEDMNVKWLPFENQFRTFEIRY
ncbi:MAG: acylphosphatase [Candidatus Neomarinimicrobiota bacterium]